MRRPASLRLAVLATALLVPLRATAGELAYAMPERFQRPATASDEGGLWALMDREERAVRQSALTIRDAPIRQYLSKLTCRLAGSHCQDVRVYLVRSPVFNASMAPNGAMFVHTGLLLRVENEAQLASVLGHELGHFFQRHSLARLRDAKDKTALGQVLGLFGLGGAVAQIALAASAMGYGRDHEREADRIGAALLRDNGYEVREAAKVWAYVIAEAKSSDADTGQGFTLFATHPPSEERQQSLDAIAASLPAGAAPADELVELTRRYEAEWIDDELKRGQPSESITLLTRLIDHQARGARLYCARGDAHRLRGRNGDDDAALRDYADGIGRGEVTARCHRGTGLIKRARRDHAGAATAFAAYLAADPAAADAELIRSYIEETPQ